MEKIERLRGEYKGSEEERGDVLREYVRGKGDLDRVFEGVLLSDVLEDEDRFRKWIESAIESGEVEAFEKFVNEPETKKKRRREKALRERREAEKEVEKRKDGVGGKKRKAGGGGRDDGLGDLAAMIQQRQKGRASTFLDDLEAKYAAPPAKKQKQGPKGKKANVSGKSRKSVDEDGPSEEAFAEMAARAKKSKRAEPVSEDDEQDEDEDEEEDLESDVDEFVSEDDEDEDEKPRKRRVGQKEVKAKAASKQTRARPLTKRR